MEGSYEKLTLAKSETVIVEALEYICPRFHSYGIEGTEPKRRFRNMNGEKHKRKGEAVTFGSIKMDKSTTDELIRICEVITENYDDDIIDLIQNDGDLYHGVCVKMAGACSKKRLESLHPIYQGYLGVPQSILDHKEDPDYDVDQVLKGDDEL